MLLAIRESFSRATYALAVDEPGQSRLRPTEIARTNEIHLIANRVSILEALNVDL